MENRLRYMSWAEFDEMRKKTDTVIIPSGACEVYGRHLPLGSDIIVAEKIAKLVADELGAVVGPCLEVGNSNALYSFTGTMYCRPESLKAVYRDICESFIKWGFKNIFIVNTHLHNTYPLNDLLLELQDEHKDKGVTGSLIGWWQYIPSFTQDVFTTSNPHGHASEAGTSVLLHLAPECVNMEIAAKTDSMYTDKYPAINKYVDYVKYTDSGTIGDATAGTAEKGKLAVERGVAQIVSYIREVMQR